MGFCYAHTKVVLLLVHVNSLLHTLVQIASYVARCVLHCLNGGTLSWHRSAAAVLCCGDMQHHHGW